MYEASLAFHPSLGSTMPDGIFGAVSFLCRPLRGLQGFAGPHPQLALWATLWPPASLAL